MKNYLVRTTTTKKILGDFDTYAEAEAFANELGAPTIIEDNFTGISEQWFGGQLTDSIRFAGGADTVAFIIKSTREDHESLQKHCAPGVTIAPLSQTFWFD